MNRNKKGGSVPIVVIYYTGIGCDPLPHLHSPDRFLIIMNEHFKEDNPETHEFDLDQWIEWVGANKIILNALGSKVIKHKKKSKKRKHKSKSSSKKKGSKRRKRR
jgi:hypothetical protein